MTRGVADDKPRGPRPLAALVPGLTRPAFARRAPASARLAADWAQIVGPALATLTHPERLTAGARAGPVAGTRAPAGPGGTLAIRAPATVAFELQHLAPQLIERINAWAGHALVARLRFVPGQPIAPSTLPRPKRPPDPDEVRRIVRLLEGVDAPALRAALGALGRAIAAEPPPQAPPRAPGQAGSRSGGAANATNSG